MKIFHRPLYNAGRWTLVNINPKFPRGAVTEQRGYGSTRQIREVLPEGYAAFPKPPKPPAPPKPQTAREIQPNGRRIFTSRSHGGGCCGRVHLSDFGYAPTISYIASLKTQTPARRCTEITLTAQQAARKGWNGYTWDAVLKELGWKLVMVFNNGNSGNNVGVYLHSTTERRLPNDNTNKTS